VVSGWLGTEKLIAERITLRPFTFDDAEQLARVVDDPGPYRWTSGVPTDVGSARQWIEKALADPEYRVAYAVVDNDSGRILGSTSFYEIDPANLSTSIGYTYYATEVQGTTVNPTAKYLLLTHAFEDCGAVRVVWHTHESNAQSRAAIAKLGATFEGLLRKHRRFGTGASGATGDITEPGVATRDTTGWRTTAQYAMTDDDWPAARAVLLGRMSGSP
jgi:RimJ/RimL family protein N-acetyltransferase